MIARADSVEEKQCLRCGMGWWSRVRNPKRCPGCKSPYWEKERGGSQQSGEGLMGGVVTEDVQRMERARVVSPGAVGDFDPDYMPVVRR